MRQRVTISYSIELDKLSNEVERLLESAFKNATNLQGLCLVPPEALSTTTLDKINDIKNCLVSLDAQLSDVDLIVRGYLNHISQAKRTDDDPLTKLEDLKQKLEDLNIDRSNESIIQNPTER
jgi:hypothetical protein